jgi:LPS sulfotransferase NodH
MYSHTRVDQAFPPTPTLRSYMVCALPRSGSSLLCEVLASTELAGAPAEFFEPTMMAALLARKTSPNGVFGIKAMYHQMRDTLGSTSPAEYFPNLRYVYVTRRDRVGQAVSFARAIQTEQWTSHQPRGKPPKFDRAQIADLLAWIEREERAWEDFFESEGATPLHVVYEDFVAQLEETVLSVLGFLEVSLPPQFTVPAPEMERQADRLSDDWKQRFAKR